MWLIELYSNYPSLPSNLTMPDFSVLSGFGEGERVSKQPVYLGCIEEYGCDDKVGRNTFYLRTL